jgi:hypothetical protein
LDTFEPQVGDVIVLRRVSVHRFDGGSLNAYEHTEILLNPEDRSDVVGLREWWELAVLEQEGYLDDDDDDLDTLT